MTVKTLDAHGLTCPMPVVRAKQVLVAQRRETDEAGRVLYIHPIERTDA